jgi:hypothetical protein
VRVFSTGLQKRLQASPPVQTTPGGVSLAILERL